MPTQIEINTDYQNAERFPAWVALSVFSAVCLAAVNSGSSGTARDAADKWVLSVVCLSMILSVVSVGMYLMMRSVFVGEMFEMGLTILLLAFWGAGLPVIMNPNNIIAVDKLGFVENANLYFSSWMSLAAIVYIFGSLAQEYTGMSVRDVAPNRKNGLWYGLCASSIVVMATSVRLFTSRQCGDDLQGSTRYCKRTKFAISVGAISFVASAVIAYLLSMGLSGIMEFIACCFLLFLWCFGVGFITFGSAPGSVIGNLYFATWVSFVLVVVLFGQSFRAFMSPAAAQTEESQEQQSGENGDQVPEIPDEEDI
ncbi:hypothetical protein MPSEU_000739700 [Mayamaea pseudoterrestris]|nr:hypothetical protein MPSEU_000739700 [Mayamaea pseudoterrestris]